MRYATIITLFALDLTNALFLRQLNDGGAAENAVATGLTQQSDGVAQTAAGKTNGQPGSLGQKVAEGAAVGGGAVLGGAAALVCTPLAH